MKAALIAGRAASWRAFGALPSVLKYQCPCRKCPSTPLTRGSPVAVTVAMCELLLSGVTSLVDISAPWDGWIELFAKSGLRGFLAPGYASAQWYLEDDRELLYRWDEQRGRAGASSISQR